MSRIKTINNAKKVVSTEKKAISDLEKRFSEKEFSKNFFEAVELIYKCKGKVIVTGIGKSGIIAQKIVATFNSTGTQSIYLHSGDSIHGDLGVVRKEDVAVIISKSGDTEEIKQLIPNLKIMKIRVIAIVGDIKSDLAGLSDIVLDASVKEEACPHNLAPTSSTTAAVVLGDALAISLLQKRDFTSDNFAFLHPGGNLGKRLLLKVGDIMSKNENVPVVKNSDSLKEVIYMISSKRLGCTCVTDKNKIAGIITDGDIRRLLEKNIDSLNRIKAKDIMNSNPKIISRDMLALSALELMEKNKITQLIVGDKYKKPLGIIHMHRLLEEGL
ncbi:MAG TPA: KpsF/GutQ family sugar-phosphate isomerase [Ignavibacteria bacterium]|nr:KpsF/GutQ family sugar-phosphate isomerase [Ignavibacteria bacterium]HMR39399.1 KpsF/GutQ family sugar-phosphate isomerase [Ignavibacteria bacterium]